MFVPDDVDVLDDVIAVNIEVRYLHPFTFAQPVSHCTPTSKTSEGRHYASSRPVIVKRERRRMKMEKALWDVGW